MLSDKSYRKIKALVNMVFSVLKSTEVSLPDLSDIHEHVADKYINLQNQANNLYKSVHTAAKEFDNSFPSGITTPEYTAKAQEILKTLSYNTIPVHPALLGLVKSITKRPQDTVHGLLSEPRKLNDTLSSIGLDAWSKSKIIELKNAARSDLANLTNNVSSSVKTDVSKYLSSIQEPCIQANKLCTEMKNLAGKNATEWQMDLLENMVGAKDYLNYDDDGNMVYNDLNRSAFDQLYLKSTTGSVANRYDALMKASGLDKEIIAYAIKNEPFKNTSDKKSFHKFYKNISKDQNAKKWLFSLKEQKVLNKAINRKPKKLTWFLFLISEVVAYHLGLPLASASFPAYLVARAGSKGINKVFSPEITPKMLKINDNNMLNSVPSNNGVANL